MLKTVTQSCLLEPLDSILRASVTSSELLETGPRHLVLKTQAFVQTKKPISSADSEMFNRLNLAAVGEKQEGRWRLDVIRDDVIRIRYAEGASIPENMTPMLAGKLQPSGNCNIQFPRIETRKLRIEIDPEFLRVEIFNLDGQKNLRHRRAGEEQL